MFSKNGFLLYKFDLLNWIYMHPVNRECFGRPVCAGILRAYAYHAAGAFLHFSDGSRVQCGVSIIILNIT